MTRKSTRKNFSIHPDDIKKMDEIFADLKKQKRPYSGVICTLLQQFRNNWYRYDDENDGPTSNILFKAVSEIIDYMESNKLNSIGNKSQLHKNLVDAFNKTYGGA